jgi:hypothetical protein
MASLIRSPIEATSRRARGKIDRIGIKSLRVLPIMEIQAGRYEQSAPSGSLFMEETCYIAPEHRSPLYWRPSHYDLLSFVGLGIVPLGIGVIAAVFYTFGQMA